MKKRLMLLLLLPSVLLAGNVEVGSDKIIYEDGGDIVVTVSNKSGQRIFLPTCDAVTFEHFTEGAFEFLPPLFCESGESPVSIAPGAQHQVTLSPKLRGDRYIRPVLTFGVGCRKDLPLELAECKAIKVERGRYISFKGRPSKRK